jgi:hypothetical protein
MDASAGDISKGETPFMRTVEVKRLTLIFILLFLIVYY